MYMNSDGKNYIVLAFCLEGLDQWLYKISTAWYNLLGPCWHGLGNVWMPQCEGVNSSLWMVLGKVKLGRRVIWEKSLEMTWCNFSFSALKVLINNYTKHLMYENIICWAHVDTGHTHLVNIIDGNHKRKC